MTTIRALGDRVLVRPLRPTKRWVTDVAGDNPDLQVIAQNLAHPYGEPDQMGEVVSIGEDLAPGRVRAVHDFAARLLARIRRFAAAPLADDATVLALAKIIAREAEAYRPALDFAVGDVVLFSPLVGQLMPVDGGDEFIALRVDDILGVVDRAAVPETQETYARTD